MLQRQESLAGAGIEVTHEPPAQALGPEPDGAELTTDDWLSVAMTARAARPSLRQVPRVVRRAVAFVWAGRPVLAAEILAMQCGSALSLVLQVLAGQWVLSAILAHQGHADLLASVLPALVVVAVVTAAGGFVDSALGLRQRLLGELSSRRVWDDVLDVTQNVDLDLFEGSRFYDHLERVRMNAVTRPALVTQGLTSFVAGLLGAVGVGAALFAIQPVLLPVLLVSGVPLWLTSRRGGQLEFEFAVAQAPSLRRRLYLTDLLTARQEAKEVRAFALGTPLRQWHVAVYDKYLADLTRMLAKKVRLTILGAGLTSAVTVVALALLMWLLSRSGISVAQAGAALIGIRLLASRITGLFSGLGQVVESALFLQELDTFRALRPVRSLVAALAGTAGFTGVTADHIGFRYPGADQSVLTDVSLSIRPGEIVALVGENGSGKTTLAKLLAGLYQPSGGTIIWNGVDLRTLDPESVRRSMAVIFQDFTRYQFTARENIGLGRAEAMEDEERVWLAAQAAGADGLLKRLPEGLETMLSKEYAGGVDLSLGQWQRIALARAFFRDAPFIILDEPTASLDARAEHDLFENMRTLLAGRTVLLISHRFSSVRTADHIHVLKAGRIIESGSHDALMQHGGLYAELFTLQASAYQA